MSNSENVELNNSNETTSYYCKNCGEFNLYGACNNCEWKPNYDYFTFDDWLNEFEDEIEQNEQNEDSDSDSDEVMNKNNEIDETRITSAAV